MNVAIQGLLAGVKIFKDSMLITKMGDDDDVTMQAYQPGRLRTLHHQVINYYYLKNLQYKVKKSARLGTKKFLHRFAKKISALRNNGISIHWGASI